MGSSAPALLTVQTPAAAEEAEEKRAAVPGHRLRAFSKVLSGSGGDAGPVVQRAASSSSMGMGLRGCVKSPKTSTVTKGNLGGAVSTARPQPSYSSPTQRASWQKLRKMKETLSASKGSSSSLTSAVGVTREPDACGWFKQRVACELLGDAPCAPWDIDEDALFHRLELLISQASAIVHAQPPAATPEGAAGGGAGAGAGGGAADAFAVTQLLLAMQKSVQENADKVKDFLEAAQPATAPAEYPWTNAAAAEAVEAAAPSQPRASAAGGDAANGG